MPSPFPGMNPHLERPRVWHIFHENYTMACQWALVPQVRPKYIVTVDDNIYIQDPHDQERQLLLRSDVSVAESELGNGANLASATIAAPVTGVIATLEEDFRESFIEIRDRESEMIVAVIELLSPSNKRPSRDREQFEYKRSLLLKSEAHYVEIDLLRGFPRMPIKNLPECDYYAMVSRYEDRPRVGLWPVSLRDPLPTIPIPLREPHEQAQLDLQAVLHHTYDASGYADYIYDGAPDPPLSEQDAAWARELVESQRRATQ